MFDFKIKKKLRHLVLNKVYVPFYDQQIQLYYIRLKSNLFFYIPPCGFLSFRSPLVRRRPLSVDLLVVIVT